MKKLLLVILSFFAINTFAQNISTGLNGGGTSEPIGGNDATWRYGTAINGASIPVIMSTLSGTWNPSPVTSTGAQFIGNNSNPGNQKAGIYFFERKINVPAGTKFLTYNFSLAADDIIQGIEIVAPSGATEKDLFSEYKLDPIKKSGYFLSVPIKGNIETCNKSGVWKIRVKVNFIDNIAGFMLSGNVATEGQCVVQELECCNGESANSLSTGFSNTTSSLLADGANEDTWKISAYSAGGALTPVKTAALTPYMPNLPDAAWIKPPRNIENAGAYDYTYTLNVPVGYKAILKFSHIGADNDVELYIDTYTRKYYSNKAGNAFTPANTRLKKCLIIDEIEPGKIIGAGNHLLNFKVSNSEIYTGLFVKGCYELVQTVPDCRCPPGWYSNTDQKEGGVILGDDGCKKAVCGFDKSPTQPKNGTPIGDPAKPWGFTWENGFYVWGTKANGGAPICTLNGKPIELKHFPESR